MTYLNLIGQYDSLRNKLEAAYASKHWDTQQIDQIAEEILKTELALARCVRAHGSSRAERGLSTP